MSLYKSSQVLDINDLQGLGHEDEVVLYDERPSKDDVIEMHQPDEGMEISFKLPPIPGSDAEMPLEVSTDDAVEVESKGKSKKDDNNLESEELEVVDPWKAPEPKNVLQWVHERLQNLPRHTGRETTGMERTVSVLKKINNEISRAIANDYNGEVDVAKLEQARQEIINGIHRLEDAIDNIEKQSYSRKKKADVDAADGLVKEGKQMQVGGIIITVPILISRIARTLINGMVSGGHDIEMMFKKQVEEYSLNKREQSELIELLDAMGYAAPRRDRGWPVDAGKVDYTSSDNYDFAANYPA